MLVGSMLLPQPHIPFYICFPIKQNQMINRGDEQNPHRWLSPLYWPEWIFLCHVELSDGEQKTWQLMPWQPPSPQRPGSRALSPRGCGEDRGCRFSGRGNSWAAQLGPCESPTTTNQRKRLINMDIVWVHHGFIHGFKWIQYGFLWVYMSLVWKIYVICCRLYICVCYSFVCGLGDLEQGNGKGWERCLASLRPFGRSWAQNICPRIWWIHPTKLVFLMTSCSNSNFCHIPTLPQVWKK